MTQIRVSTAQDTGRQDECNLIHIASYEMKEVILPVLFGQHNVKAIQVTVRGRNLRAVAQPLLVFVGGAALRFLHIAPDERSVDGILLQEPAEGTYVEVHLGDQDAARHPQPVVPDVIKRI